MHLTTTTIRRLRVDIFSELDDHIKEQEPLFDHKYELIKLILSSYFNIRMDHGSAIASQPVKRIRKLRLKETLFKHQ